MARGRPGIKYVFRDEPLQFKGSANANPQKIGTALAQITAENNGRLTPKAVVDSARDEASPLHPHFEWDDQAAAEKWREDQARMIIRCVRIEAVDDDHDPEPAWLSVSDKGGVSYRAVQEVKGSAALQEIILAAAQRDLDAFEKRYSELEDVCSLVAKAKSLVKAKRRGKGESRPSV